MKCLTVASEQTILPWNRFDLISRGHTETPRPKFGEVLSTQSAFSQRRQWTIFGSYSRQNTNFEFIRIGSLARQGCKVIDPMFQITYILGNGDCKANNSLHCQNKRPNQIKYAFKISFVSGYKFRNFSGGMAGLLLRGSDEIILSGLNLGRLSKDPHKNLVE